MNATKMILESKHGERSISTDRSLSRRAFVAVSAATATQSLLPTGWAAEPTVDSEDLLFSSVMAISAAIRAKRISAMETVQTFLNRIETVNPKINAVVTVAADRALAEARRADAELARGMCRGILHGVPMTIKDSFDTAGVVSTAGTLGRKTYVPKKDATVVARLRAAGAILLGKTNTPEFTMSYDTRNLLFGFTKNPYNLEMSPGGSSGGAAAAIAVGASPFDMGSDTGGSIRVPSCFSGIAGIKPTTGRMPLTGHIIHPGQGLLDPLTQVGPMARFVDDLHPLLKITTGPDGKDATVVPAPLGDPFFVEVNNLRVAFHTDNGIMPANPDVKRTVESAASELADAGAQVQESCPKALAGLANFWTHIYSTDGGEWATMLLQQSGTKHWDPHIDWCWSRRSLTGKEITELVRTWQRFRDEMLAWMNQFDVLICPVNARASWRSGFGDEEEEGSVNAFTYTSAFNTNGWPAAVVRGGTSDDGMPIGVQVVAGPWKEDVCLAVAKYLESALGGWKKPSL